MRFKLAGTSSRSIPKLYIIPNRFNKSEDPRGSSLQEHLRVRYQNNPPPMCYAGNRLKNRGKKLALEIRATVAGFESSPTIESPVLSTCPLHTISGCGKERHILIGPWRPAKATTIWNYLEIYWPCAGGLSAVNAIGTQLRDPINSGLTPMAYGDFK